MKPTIREILQGRFQATNIQGQSQNFDDHKAAVEYSETGTMIEYKGFEIDPVTFEIARNNKLVTGSYWRCNVSVEAAKITIDAYLMTNVLPAPAVVRAVLAYDETEAAKELEEMRESERVNDHHDRELNEKY